MNKIKNRKKYLVDVYAKYWLNAREEKYGFSQYDKNCIKLITKHTVRNSRFLDVGIGTGYPYASELSKFNEIIGIDISPIIN